MAVKRKWFLENAELRREDFNTDQPVAFADIETHARSMTSASLRRLKPFRRTRIDINFESLRTGNGFGAYFDVCRMVDGVRSSPRSKSNIAAAGPCTRCARWRKTLKPSPT